MDDLIRILLLDGSVESRESIKSLLNVLPRFKLVGEGSLDNNAPLRVLSDTPDIVLVSIEPGDTENSIILEHISAQSPDVGIIVLSEHKDWYLVRQYMRAGAKDYLYMPVTPVVLERTIDEVVRLVEEKQVISPTLQRQRETSAHCKTVVFFSGKGGVGRTTLSVNTATALALAGNSTVLVDLALHAGVDHIWLNITPTWTLVDLVQQAQQLDRELFQSYLSYHQESGLWLLPAPHSPEEMELLTESDLRLILKALQNEFDFVVVDTAALPDALLFAALELATQGYLVNTKNIANLQNNQSLLADLQEHGLFNKVAAVLNNADSRGGITTQDIAQTLQIPLLWKFPSNYTLVETSANSGIPFVLGRKRSRLAKNMDTFVRRVLIAAE
ncbi:response regulator [Alicyclobacillaceae bacterium I2511]|nr:response regulator [Alicyclobacillaceae bacterium I2511]